MIVDVRMLWAVPLVAFLGYASHRASLCTVRAVADVLGGRRFDMLGGFARAVLWAMLITVPASYYYPEKFPLPVADRPLWTGLLGGLLFGLGAALNRGCSFSTLQRLADGDWRMLASLAGFMAGSSLWYWLQMPESIPLQLSQESPFASWRVPLMFALVVWAVVEAYRLWRRRIHRRSAMNYSPAVTAVILGLGGGILYLGFGSWTYSNSLQAAAGALVGEQLLPSALQLALVPALLSGTLLSAWRRGAWSSRKPVTGWVLNVSGGIFMGLGAALIPGGNDTLLLRLIPTMTPHSLWSYLMVVAGVAIGLMLMRRFGSMPCDTVGCGSDVPPVS